MLTDEETSIKRYFAENMTSALSSVREHEGADAVIVSRRRLADGVELMVAPTVPELTDSIDDEVLIASDLASLSREVAELKKLLKGMGREVASPQSTSAPGQSYRKLRSLGFTKNLVKQLLDDAAGSYWRDCLRHLPALLNTPGDDPVARGGLFVLVGPAGSGKSTTIAKLATRYVLANGPDSVALVTMDTFGIAAQEPLRAIGRILGVPVQVVDKQHSLERVLHDLRHKSLVLVDTAGLSLSDPRLRQQMTRIDELGKRASTLLVMPANSQRAACAAACQTYRTANFSGCVLSKLDDTASLGEVLDFSITQALPLAYITNGQEIPDDIAVADGEELVRILLSKFTRSREPVRSKQPEHTDQVLSSSLDKA